MKKTLINILVWMVEIASMLAFFCVIAVIPSAIFLTWYLLDTYTIALPAALLCALTVSLITAGLTCITGLCCGVWSRALEREKAKQ